MANKRVEALVERSTKHGHAGRETRSRTYLIWQSMIGRCHRPSDSSYKWYGAKGITVCDRWRKFEDFFADMGEAPNGTHIHRTIGATVYSKETCQWLNESEHIGLHNRENGWGARMTRAQLIDALAESKRELAAEREKYVEQREDWIREIQELQDQLAAAAGEWTEQSVEQIAFSSGHATAYKLIAEAHNAAIAAEREKLERESKEADRLTDKCLRLHNQIETLVDALEIARGALQGVADDNFRSSGQWVIAERAIKCIDAKVKEGK